MVAIIGGAGAARADDGIYAGASAGQSRLNPRQGRSNFSNFNYDDTDEGYKLIVGIRPVEFVGAEINYVDLGRTNGVGSNSFGGSVSKRADAQLIDASAVGYLPLPFADVFGKAGVARSWARFREFGMNDQHIDSTNFAWGGGAQLHFGAFAARLEYEKFNIPSAHDAALLSFGVTWTFL